jgi:hypothetical protein
MRVDQAGHDGLVLCGNAFDVRPAVGEGIGVGTDAEGWVADAAAFWKSVSEE